MDEEGVTWNYRVMQDETGYSIREVFYENGDVVAWTAVPVAVWGETLDALVWGLAKFNEAVQQPVLKIADLLHGQDESGSGAESSDDYFIQWASGRRSAGIGVERDSEDVS